MRVSYKWRISDTTFVYITSGEDALVDTNNNGININRTDNSDEYKDVTMQVLYYDTENKEATVLERKYEDNFKYTLFTTEADINAVYETEIEREVIQWSIDRYVFQFQLMKDVLFKVIDELKDYQLKPVEFYYDLVSECDTTYSSSSNKSQGDCICSVTSDIEVKDTNTIMDGALLKTGMCLQDVLEELFNRTIMPKTNYVLPSLSVSANSKFQTMIKIGDTFEVTESSLNITKNNGDVRNYDGSLTHVKDSEIVWGEEIRISQPLIEANELKKYQYNTNIECDYSEPSIGPKDNKGQEYKETPYIWTNGTATTAFTKTVYFAYPVLVNDNGKKELTNDVATTNKEYLVSVEWVTIEMGDEKDGKHVQFAIPQNISYVLERYNPITSAWDSQGTREGFVKDRTMEQDGITFDIVERKGDVVSDNKYRIKLSK